MKILFFAQLKETAGVSEAELEIGDLDTAGLWAHLLDRWPSLVPLQTQVRLARNGAYAAGDEVFLSNDEVALIPPVSGG
jgi:molybdopterin converting factor subunit 1